MEVSKKILSIRKKKYWTLTFGNLFASEGRPLKGPHSCSSILSEIADGEGVFVLENTWRQAKGHSLIGWRQAYESPSQVQSPHLEPPHRLCCSSSLDPSSTQLDSQIKGESDSALNS